MNVVLDTNIVIFAFFRRGKPRVILDQAVSKRITGFVSEVMLDELANIINKKFFSLLASPRILRMIRKNFVLVHPKTLPNLIKVDANDDIILAVTHEAKIDYIITGDHHLLDLGQYNDTPIVTAAQFLDLANK